MAATQEQSTAELLRQLSEQTTTLVRQEIELRDDIARTRALIAP